MAGLIPPNFDFEKYISAPPESAQIHPASDWTQAVVDRFYGDKNSIGAYLPWSKTHTELRLRPGELSIWAGVNGHGKSMLLSQIMLGVLSQDEKVCIASMEMKPVATMARMSRQAGRCAEPSIDFIKKFHAWTDGKLWLYDQQGIVKSSRMIALARYCREELGIDHFVIDSMMKCGIVTDDYNGQKNFVNELHCLAQDTGLHVHLVAHLRKSGSEMDQPDKMDVKGAGEIVDQTDNLFIVWRNKRKEEQARKNDPKLDMNDPDALLVCSKQRHGESEPHYTLWFDKESMQYVGKSSAPTIDHLQWEAA